MTSSDFAFLISGFSLAIAMLARVWNVSAKFVFVKPRLQVSFGVFHVIQNGIFGKELLSLTITNMDPGPAVIHSCIAQARTRRFWKIRLAMLNPIHNDPASNAPTSIGPFSAGLPLKLDASEVHGFYFPFTAETFLREPVTRVGVTDTYGRKAWCRRRDVKEALHKFREKFSSPAHTPS